ncbi:hypothetical protein EVG20_g11231 [Dentipellis fragilis]|uniref:Uncharacterized protein n=1 Tax=Dentipellis fragilis TaxID=205917 RepID=A0A4Y9XLL3_9AGAM|nr:hypothetical protein EVG20_g11231 [Dentipellis fragilis]
MALTSLLLPIVSAAKLAAGAYAFQYVWLNVGRNLDLGSIFFSREVVTSAEIKAYFVMPSGIRIQPRVFNPDIPDIALNESIASLQLIIDYTYL